MAKNVLYKAAFVRGELDDFEKRSYRKKDIIRTDFILENLFSHLVQEYYNFNALSSRNEKETNLCEISKKILDAFRDNYANPMTPLLAEVLDVICEDEIVSMLLEVSDVIFSEVITWCRIITYFIFVGELTVMCIIKKLPKSFVDVLYENFSRSVKEKVELWIEDHNGWEGIKSFSSDVTKPSFKMSNSSFAKTLLYSKFQTHTEKRSQCSFVQNTCLQEDNQVLLEKRKEDFTERLLCNICVKNERDVVFLNCKHLICCKSCSKNCDKCPVCRERISGIIKIFIS